MSLTAVGSGLPGVVAGAKNLDLDGPLGRIAPEQVARLPRTRVALLQLDPPLWTQRADLLDREVDRVVLRMGTDARFVTFLIVVGGDLRR